MKSIKIFLLLLVSIGINIACDPIEDDSLRDRKETTITKADLEAAISIIQPYPNQEGVIKGDQYIVVKNSRPDIGGAWRVQWGESGRYTSTKDVDTIICSANAVHSIYYVGVSGRSTIKTDPRQFEVTNVFKDWDRLLTSAENKADRAAKKAWRFREVEWESICNMGAHGGWRPSNGHTPESKNVWWANHTYSEVGDVKMVFEYNDSKFKTYNADGSLKAEGEFSYDDVNKPDPDAPGTLTTSIPTIGSQFDDAGQKTGSSNIFWVLRLEENYMTIFHPLNPTNPVDWTDSGWYAYFEAIEEE